MELASCTVLNCLSSNYMVIGLGNVYMSESKVLKGFIWFVAPVSTT